MRVKGLDGREYSWYLVGYQPKLSDERPRSALHLEVRELLRATFPSSPLLEEVPLPGSGGLFADFYLPQQKKMVEAHGRQHYEYVHFFHGDMMGFIKGKKRDSNKAEWCRINNITLIVCSYKETVDVWKELLI
jgi:hypothetical protein